VNVIHVSNPIYLLTGKLESYVKYVAALSEWTHISLLLFFYLDGWPNLCRQISVQEHHQPDIGTQQCPQSGSPSLYMQIVLQPGSPSCYTKSSGLSLAYQADVNR